MSLLITILVIALIFYFINKKEEQEKLKKELEVMKQQISYLQGRNSNSQNQNNQPPIAPQGQMEVPKPSGNINQNEDDFNHLFEEENKQRVVVANQSLSEIPTPPSASEQDIYSELFQQQEKSDESEQDKHNFIDWIKDGFLLKLGSLFILISVGWFISYAFVEKQWIGEIGVTTIGVLFGAAILIWGTLRVVKYKRFGDVFVILGTSISIFVTTYAVHAYGLFGNGFMALLLMFLILSFSTFVSVRFDLKNIVRVNILFAAFLPLLAGMSISSENYQIFFMIYLLVVLLGTLWVVWFTRWREFILYCLVMALFYSTAITGYYSYTNAKLHAVTVILSFITILVFFVTNTVGIVRQETEKRATKFILPSMVALGTVFLIGVWTNAIFYREDMKIGFLLFIWALVFAFGSFVVTRLTQNKKAFYLYGSLSIALLGTATAYVLEGATLTLVLALEILALVVAAAKITEKSKIPTYLSFLYSLPVLMSIDQYDRLGRFAREKVTFLEKLNADFWSVTIVAVAVVFSAFLISPLLKRDKEEEGEKSKNELAPTLFNFLAITAGILAFGWYVLFLNLLTSRDLATFITIFTVVSLGLVLLNLNTKKKVYQIVGYILLTYGVLMLFFGTGTLDVLYKVLIFALIGVLFIATELNKKKKSEAEAEEVG